MFNKLKVIVAVVMMLFAAQALSGLFVEKMLRIVLLMAASLIFLINLRKSDDARWEIILVLICLCMPFSLSVVAISYAMWCYYRRTTSEPPDTDETCRNGEDAAFHSQLQHFFAGIRIRYFAVWYVFSLICAFFVACAIAGYWFKSKDDLLLLNLLSLSHYALILFWVSGKTQKYGTRLGQLVGSAPEKYEWLEMIFLLMMTLLFDAGSRTLVLNAESLFFPTHVQEILSYNPLRDTAGPFAGQQRIVWGLLVIFIGPVMEELMFRGIVLQRLATKYDLKRAILISSLMFGILHGDDGAVAAFVAGVILAVLYIKSKTLIVPIMLHITHNAISFLCMWGTLTFQYASTVEQLRSEFWLGITFTVISFTAIFFYLRKNWPGPEGARPVLTIGASDSI